MADAFGALARVVRDSNCSGCGACAALAKNLRMDLSADGYMRPVRREAGNPLAELDRKLFEAICPGVALEPPPHTHSLDRLFGRYISVWQGHAVDPEVRQRGSSGGVLTALTAWLVEGGDVEYAVGAAHEPGTTRSVPVVLRSRAAALEAAGSRYAPVSVAQAFDPQSGGLFIGKPCEVAAVARAENELGDGRRGIKFSFFCAGTPSQSATDELVASQVSGPIKTLRYRGQGWPGELVVEGVNGERTTMDYETAWSSHLGPTIQWRCKICPDGTGEYADISVGDFWESDEQGFPVFSDRPGSSVVIARTELGDTLLRRAVEAGVIGLSSLDIDMVRRVQPSQVLRRESLGARIVGSRLAGLKAPRFRGYRIIQGIAAHPLRSVRAAAGTWSRVRRGKAGVI